MGYSKGVVSFCCLSYNHGKYIRRCIESIWNQTYKKIEIIVLDDGSPDNSLDVIKQCQYESPCKFIVLTQENSGGKVGSNFNRLISESSGEFLFFISCDDEVVVDSVTSKINFFDSDKNLAFVLNTYVESIDESSQILNQFYVHDEYKNISNISDLLELEFNSIGSFYIQGGIFKRSVIDAVGGFDNDLLGDDIILRTKIYQYIANKEPSLNFKLLDTVGVRYRMHDSNVHKNTYRQSILTYQWFKRYFSDRKPNKMMLLWLNSAYAYTIDNCQLEKSKEIITILEDYLTYFDIKQHQKIVYDFYYTGKVKRYQLNKTVSIDSEMASELLGDMLIEDGGELFIEESQAEWLLEYLLHKNQSNEIQLNCIYKSFGWKLLKPLRLIKKLLK
ncbi:glycosyltransferase family 2 protein [Francisella sp. SYW-9]|uniref:glycosyltransferase family 2 protein n=1 Tax=Francisella sp. SYW-9 TaxID=2610888 RepID=UPI00123D2ED3|nr:glycosyltransferase family 2 protein [Francisella sp. SYW-9]